MTEPRFEELINLYLDNEIGRHELGELKNAIRDNVLRKQKFERACQLHQAARKALASREDGGPVQGEPPEAGTASAASRTSTSISSRARSSNSSGGGQGSARSKQGQAFRNASVTTLAERQLNKGAASSVDVSKINLESDRSVSSFGRSHAFSFFDSPLGMIMAGGFTLVGVAALYLLLKAGAPGDVDSEGMPTGNSLVNTPSGPVDQKELLRELQRGHRGAANAAEAMHANIYQSAVGPPANNFVQVNYSTAQTSTATTDAMPRVALPNETAPNTTGTTMTVQIMQSSLTPPANGSVGVMNSSQLQVTLPAAPGASGNQDVWVKMSLPTVVMPPAASGSPDKPANGTLPQTGAP